jgi:hypothetical protein
VENKMNKEFDENTKKYVNTIEKINSMCRLSNNYHELMNMSDDELKIKSCNGASLYISGIRFPNATLENSVVKQLKSMVYNVNTDYALDRELIKQCSEAMEKISNRTMTKEEYEIIKGRIII